MDAFDVVIIGAGVSGAACARELSKRKLRIGVLEREEDVCCGTSKANSAIVHAGFDAEPGTLMAELDVRGVELMGGLCADLDVDLDNIGSLVVCTAEEDLPKLEELLARGRKNGVEPLTIIYGDELRALEPNIADGARAALWAPSACIVNPFQLTWALAENARVNGVEFFFNTEVIGIAQDDGLWTISTTRGGFAARAVVNAAGVYADALHNMVSADTLEIIPRRGQYLVLDTAAGRHVSHTVFQLPTKYGKGVLVTPTTAGNLLVGPTAEDIADKEATDTTAAGLAEVLAKSVLSVKDIPFHETITSFSGLRAHRKEHDFLIGELPDAPGFVDCAAIESPGLTAAPAIGEMVAGIVDGILGPEMRGDFVPARRGIPAVEWACDEDWEALIAEDAAYGHVVCRCRKVTEAQIVAAIRSPLGARSLDGIKRRTEACMGRCQAGFCTSKIMDILDRELADLAYAEITKAGPGSELLVGRDKELGGGGLL
ncbi:FAD/NAD(P)-binding oxidoreductase [Coriobacteriales bacterium OH1046]|nr:FAD/NAD(P)-binding oxidoreductase [Coriobacteriales bacterium OH1046]